MKIIVPFCAKCGGRHFPAEHCTKLGRDIRGQIIRKKAARLDLGLYCQDCGGPIIPKDTRNLNRKWCKDVCRMRAFRKRQKSG